MSVVAEFTVTAGEFPLGRILSELPDVTVELERIVPTGHAVVPYFWASGVSDEDLTAAFEDQPEVELASVVDHVGDDTLVRVEWGADDHGLLTGLAENDIVLLSASGTCDRWRFDVRASDRESLTNFHRYCTDHGITLAVERVQTLVELDSSARGLTEPQREALLAAYEAGYFDTPRETTLEDVASELGISRQALSDRLRRGYNTLVRLFVAPSSSVLDEDDYKELT